MFYEVVAGEPPIVLMPSDHPLTAQASTHPRALIGETFICGSHKAAALRDVTQANLRSCGMDIKPD
ncbi:MAG TPA: hypothetical protein VK696_05405 [Steroidobacteraceae bacterium]|nr:hypothetical protein [Steroidobacteraceae bacterium]